MKKYLFLVFLIGVFGCAVTPDQKWLAAAQHMVTVVNDPYVSTTNFTRIKLLEQWSVKNGYTMSVSHADEMGNVNTNMYFAVVKKK